MKGIFIELWLRFMTWLTVKIGAYSSVSKVMSCGIRNIEELEEELEILYVISKYPYSRLDYMDRMIKIRCSARILETLKLIRPEISVGPQSEVEKLKNAIEYTLGIEIEKLELGFRYNNKSISTWALNCSEENKRRLELLSIVLFIAAEKL